MEDRFSHLQFLVQNYGPQGQSPYCFEVVDQQNVQVVVVHIPVVVSHLSFHAFLLPILVLLDVKISPLKVAEGLLRIHSLIS